MYLDIPVERFMNAYNDYRFIPEVDIIGPDTKNPLEYVSWATASKYLKELFPELVVEFERREDGSYVFKEDNYLVKESAREDFLQLIKEKKEQLNVTTDWKEKKSLPKEIAELYAQLHYNNRGVYVLPYLVDVNTGLRTPSLYFPAMNDFNDSIYNPSSRDINDTKARGGVKAIALYTGLFFRIFTREDIEDKKLIKDSPKWKRISSIIEFCSMLGREVDKSIHLGLSITQLSNVANGLWKEVEELKKSK